MGWFLPNDQFPGNHLFDRSTFKRPRMSVGSLERKTVEMNSKLGWGKPLQAVCQREESSARGDLPLVAIQLQFRKSLVPDMLGEENLRVILQSVSANQVRGMILPPADAGNGVIEMATDR
jgi:hypothetical protein